MIQLAENFDTLGGFCGNAFSCRIRATADAYGFGHPFARFWTQGHHAAICMLDDAMVLDARPDADFGELAAFLSATGARTLLCATEAAEKLPFCASDMGEIMALHAPFPPADNVIEWDPSPRELHALLCACETAHFIPPPFEPFYLDLSHRTRHGTACSAAVRLGDALAACAVCSARADGAAVLSAVAVHPSFRRRGLGARVVRALAAHLAVDIIYIFRAENENEAFYRSLGFAGCGGFAELSIQNRRTS